MRNTIVSSMLAGAVVFSVAAFALAADQTTPTALGQTIKDQRQQLIATRCDELNTQVDTKIKLFTEAKQHHITRYEWIKDRLDQLVSRLKGKNVDTSKLEGDLSTLKDKLTKAGADTDTLIQDLQNTKAYTCGNSQGQFVTALQTARQQRLVVFTDMQNVRSFITETIRPDLLALRTAVKSATPSATTGL